MTPIRPMTPFRGIFLQWGFMTPNLAKALSAFQGELKNAPKDSENPFFNSAYSSLASCWETIRPLLAKHKLAITQLTKMENGEMYLETKLMHESGEEVFGVYPIWAKDKSPQAVGSALSYAKRYALQAVIGLASEDDDGAAAQPHPGHAAAERQRPAQKTGTEMRPSDAQIKRLFAIAHKNHWRDEDLKEYLGKMGIESTKDLNWFQYENLCKKIEAYPRGNAAQ